jgi:hypothetical protein
MAPNVHLVIKHNHIILMKKIYGGHQVYFHLTLVRKYLATTIFIFLLERRKLNEKNIWWPLYVGFFQPKKK